MTLAPTHFTLQGIILWQVMRKEDRDHFLTNQPWMILALNLVANIPDLDDKIGLHRGPVHSLFLALLSLLITGLFYRWYKNKHSPSKNTSQRRVRILIYTEIMWLLHILLDMNTPIALFWPLTDQVFTVNFVLLISIFPVIVLGIVLLPYEILGLSLDVQTESFIAGLKFYLTNLSLEERQQVFPEILSLIIFDFIIHVLIAISWILIVGKPLTHAFWNKYLQSRWHQWDKKQYKALLKALSSAIQWEWLLLMILITFSGLILTTGTGPHEQITQSFQEELKITPLEFSPFHVLAYERPFQLIPPPTRDVEVAYSIENINQTNVTTYQMWIFVLPISSVEYLQTQLTSLYAATNLSKESQFSSFKDSYKTVIQQAIPIQNRITTVTSEDRNLEAQFVPPTSEKIFNVGVIINDWSLPPNNTWGFSIMINIHYTIVQHQEGIFYFGHALQLIGAIATLALFPILPVFNGLKEVKRNANDEKE